MNQTHMLKLVSIEKNPTEHYTNKGKRFEESSYTMISWLTKISRGGYLAKKSVEYTKSN